MAVCAGAIDSVFCWGFNGWGELGLGDLSIRLQPTKVSALKHVKVRQVVAGERHSLVVLRHQVLCARDLPVLQPFFQVRLLVYDGLSSSSFDDCVWTPTERKISMTLLINLMTNPSSNGFFLSSSSFMYSRTYY